MKPLIVTIILAILAIFITGCDVVEKHYHGHERRVVVVAPPRRMPVRPERRPHPDARRYGPRRPNPRFKRMHR